MLNFWRRKKESKLKERENLYTQIKNKEVSDIGNSYLIQLTISELEKKDIEFDYEDGIFSIYLYHNNQDKEIQIPLIKNYYLKNIDVSHVKVARMKDSLSITILKK